MKKHYQTPARRALLDFFASRPDRQFTAEQICTLLCDTGDRMTASGSENRREFVGKSTVYRQLSRLVEQGLLRRFEDVTPDGAAVHVYQYRADACCDRHFHLKCTKCGRLEHLSCNQAEGLLEHIRADHGFFVDSAATVLYGCCKHCRET
jgi:Fur family ferric uptake transcriptional regulator